MAVRACVVTMVVGGFGLGFYLGVWLCVTTLGDPSRSIQFDVGEPHYRIAPPSSAEEVRQG